MILCGHLGPSPEDLAVVEAFGRWLSGEATPEDLALLHLRAGTEPGREGTP